MYKWVGVHACLCVCESCAHVFVGAGVHARMFLGVNARMGVCVWHACVFVGSLPGLGAYECMWCVEFHQKDYSGTRICHCKREKSESRRCSLCRHQF